MKPRPHPLGVESSPDWDAVWKRYVELSEGPEPEAANDDEPMEHEPSAFGLALVLIAIMTIAFAAIGAIQ